MKTDDKIRARVRELAARLEVGEAELLAVRAVEAPGDPRAVRFEPHLFVKVHPRAVPYTPKSSTQPWSVRAHETNRAAFDRAFAIDPRAAIRSSSFGMGQVLGAKLLDLEPDPGAALRLFDADPVTTSISLWELWFAAPQGQRALERLRAHDWQGFARFYNGPGQAEFYGRKLAEAFARETV